MNDTINYTYENSLIDSSLETNTIFDNIVTKDNIYFISYLTFLQVAVYNFIYLLDYFLCKYYTDKARWFQLHSMANLFVCIFCISDIISIFYDVNQSAMPLTDYIGGSFALQVHLYHTLNFPLTTMDKYHHISSVFLCFPPSMIFNKKILSLFYFIGTGLPGGIDYLLLTLVKNGKLDYLKEKKYNSYINAYIRMPGGAICSFLTFSASLNNDILLERLCGYFLSFIVFTNTAFFGKLAIENYVERLENNKIKNN